MYKESHLLPCVATLLTLNGCYPHFSICLNIRHTIITQMPLKCFVMIVILYYIIIIIVVVVVVVICSSSKVIKFIQQNWYLCIVNTI